MAIKKRLTESFKLVYPYDPALLVFTDDEMMDYLNKGRDLSLLNLDRCKEPPTIFKCKPLKPKYQYLLNNVKDGTLTFDQAWSVFRVHVEEVENFDGLEWTEGVDPQIKDDCEKLIHTDCLMDVASTIVRKAGDIDINFTVPVSFWGMRGKLRLLHASDVDTETANETTST